MRARTRVRKGIARECAEFRARLVPPPRHSVGRRGNIGRVYNAFKHTRAYTPERNRVPFICECTSPVYGGYDLPPPLFPCLRTLLVNASRGRGVASLLERERLSFVERKNTRVNNRNKRGGRKREEDRIREFRDYGC